MSDYRVSMKFGDGSTYSYIEVEGDEWLVEGSWIEPYDNQEGSSSVYDLLEAVSQGDGPLSLMLWQSGEPISVTITKEDCHND